MTKQLFASKNPGIDGSDGIPFDQSLEWVLDTLLKLPADHLARTPGLIGSIMIDDESDAHKVELWVDDNPHMDHPAAFLWVQDAETGELIEHLEVRYHIDKKLEYTGDTAMMRVSNFPYGFIRVELKDDSDQLPPWELNDGHGPVRGVDARHGLKFQNIKRPGERFMHRDGWTVWLYDWQAASKKARAEGWNAEPYGAPHPIQRAVEADFQRMCAFVRQDWCYVGIELEASTGALFSVWGFESDDPQLHEHAFEMVGELKAHSVADLATHLNAQAAEAAEREYWEARDVQTGIDGLPWL